MSNTRSNAVQTASHLTDPTMPNTMMTRDGKSGVSRRRPRPPCPVPETSLPPSSPSLRTPSSLPEKPCFPPMPRQPTSGPRRRLPLHFFTQLPPRASISGNLTPPSLPTANSPSVSESGRCDAIKRSPSRRDQDKQGDSSGLHLHTHTGNTATSGQSTSLIPLAPTLPHLAVTTKRKTQRGTRSVEKQLAQKERRERLLEEKRGRLLEENRDRHGDDKSEQQLLEDKRERLLHQLTSLIGTDPSPATPVSISSPPATSPSRPEPDDYPALTPFPESSQPLDDLPQLYRPPVENNPDMPAQNNPDMPTQAGDVAEINAPPSLDRLAPVLAKLASSGDPAALWVARDVIQRYFPYLGTIFSGHGGPSV